MELIVAWIVYLLAAIGIASGLWWWTRTWSRLARQFVRAVLAAWLFTPYSIELGSSELAPAWLMLGFEMVAEGVNGAGRTGKPLLASLLIVLAIVGFEHCAYLYRRVRRYRRAKVRRREAQLARAHGELLAQSLS